MASDSELMIFGGSGSPMLAASICERLGVRLRAGEARRFSEGNTFVRVGENVRGMDVYLVQSTSFPVNDNFMELLFWIDAFKRASTRTVTVVIPYFSYAKGDKKDEPRVSIRARVCADALEAAGADRVVTMDLHAPQIQGFFKIPVDDLYALPAMCEAVRKRDPKDLVVVSPDVGFAKKARAYADYLCVPFAIADKRRTCHDERAEILEVIGEVRGRTALIVDDFSISCGTLVETAEKLVELGARSVIAAITHGVFSPGARDRLDRSRIERLFVTDTIEARPEPLSSKVQVVSVAPLFAEALRRIHDRLSISVLFEGIK
jgi:ribose-phosphate pyrophosphokinase